MGTVYARGSKLWVGYKDRSGKWQYAPTEFRVGQEDKARKVVEDLEAMVRAETEVGGPDLGPITVRRYAEKWFRDRRARGLASTDTEEGRIKLHVLPELGDTLIAKVRPRDVRELVRRLRLKKSERKELLAPRSVRHIYGTLHTMFEDAVADELIEINPCSIKRGELPKKIDQDPHWRPSAIFSRAEVETILSDPGIPDDRRALYGLLLLGGLRFGEASALRWRHYDEAAAPLGKLVVAASYETKRRKEKSVKTERPRDVPVHPVLAAILADWKQGGCAEMLGRPLTADDLLVPSRENRNRNVNHGLKRFHQDLERLGLRSRRQHDLRRTFITLAREDGARKDILEWVTHGPRGDIVDLYTTLPWSLLCEEVGKLRIELRERPAHRVMPRAKPAESRQPPSGLLQSLLQSGFVRPKQAGLLAISGGPASTTLEPPSWRCRRPRSRVLVLLAAITQHVDGQCDPDDLARETHKHANGRNGAVCEIRVLEVSAPTSAGRRGLDPVQEGPENVAVLVALGRKERNPPARQRGPDRARPGPCDQGPRAGARLQAAPCFARSKGRSRSQG